MNQNKLLQSESLGFGHQPALVVCDVTRGYTDPNFVYGFDMTKEIKVIQQLIQKARSKAIPIFFTTIAYTEAEIRHPNLWMKKIPGITALVLGEDVVDIVETLDYQKAVDDLIIKKYASIFFGTDLTTRLNNHQVDTIILAGCTTSGCVRASAVDGLQYGYRPILVAEAVADRCDIAHQQALKELGDKYADVMTVEKVMTYLSQLP